MADSLNCLVDRVHATVPPRVALELQWRVEGDDDDAIALWVLDLHVLVAQPGKEHSQYSSVHVATFAAEELSERREAQRIARAVAERVALPLYAPAIEEHGGYGGSRWIRQQPTGPNVRYELRWQASWWTDAGLEEAACGVEAVAAESGRDARALLERQLAQRLTARPLELATCIAGESESRITFDARYSDGLPPLEAVRALALAEAYRPSRVVRALISQAETASALSLMVAFHHAFGVELNALVPIASWRAGEIDDDALDAQLSVEVEARRAEWDRPRALREARRAGHSIAALIRAQHEAGSGTIRLIKALRDAFGLSLGDAERFVDLCQDSRSDIELNALLPTN